MPVASYRWPLGHHLAVAVGPILLLLLVAAAPLLVKLIVGLRSRQRDLGVWMYPVDIGFMPVSCSACEAFKLRVAATDSLVGSIPYLSWVAAIILTAMWIQALRAARAWPGRQPDQHVTTWVDSVIQVMLVWFVFVVLSFMRFPKH